ncbi:OadG family protein [Saccharicrinis sp. FJH54]|uniref:OadG family protein n=1 Tax=Saccharicrinis sp. FJH54 TaxID=3344665 RepID=UPI0035D40088
MNADYQLAFSLLAIGMITVFIILLLVVYVGKAIILFTNRFIKLPVTEKIAEVKQTISPKKLAAISAAVSIVTNGKGIVEKVEKL